MNRAHWVVATHNPGKLTEFQALFADLPMTLSSAGELGLPAPEETGTTFVENALLKAKAASRAAGLPAIADDSGLLVRSLGDAPGVRSARYAGPNADDAENVNRLLAELEGEADRAARFVCLLAAVRSSEDPVPVIVQREWRGTITEAPQGEGGFGYDPVFWLPDRGITAAELPKHEKNRLSHRGQAARALRDILQSHEDNET